MVFYVDRASVTAGGTLSFIRTGRDAPTLERAAVFMCALYLVISPRVHFMPCPAERSAVFVERNVRRCIFRCFGTSVDIPSFQQLISGDVVMGGIQADILREKPIGIAPEVIHGIEEVLTVVVFCTGKFHEEGELGLQPAVPAAEHVEVLPEIPSPVAAVPAPFCIGVGIMAAAGIPEGAGVRA